MVSRPGDPGNGVPLGELADRARIDIAYGGSCTAGKREDFDHYHAVLAWAARQGLRVPDGVKLYLQFGTTAVRDYCIERGYLDAFEKVGAQILQPSCGACANCGPGLVDRPGQVTVSAINRNFPGRSGPGQVWLASPPTVAASAIAGRLVVVRGAALAGARRHPHHHLILQGDIHVSSADPLVAPPSPLIAIAIDGSRRPRTRAGRQADPRRRSAVRRLDRRRRCARDEQPDGQGHGASDRDREPRRRRWHDGHGRRS